MLPPTLDPVCSVDVGAGRYRQTPTSGSSFRHIQAPRHSPRRLDETHAETSLSPAAKPLKTVTKTPENLFKIKPFLPRFFPITVIGNCDFLSMVFTPGHPRNMAWDRSHGVMQEPSTPNVQTRRKEILHV